MVDFIAFMTIRVHSLNSVSESCLDLCGLLFFEHAKQVGVYIVDPLSQPSDALEL